MKKAFHPLCSGKQLMRGNVCFLLLLPFALILRNTASVLFTGMYTNACGTKTGAPSYSIGKNFSLCKRRLAYWSDYKLGNTITVFNYNILRA